jgi:hypothetical protein
MGASDYQRVTEAALRRHFADVRLEWSVVTDATDALAADINRYAPRVDIAVGPFNTAPGPDPRINGGLLPEGLRALFDDRPPNPNPRCLLAIEVIYSGSSKHILGDMLNAGALGLYGIVVGREALMPKIRRIGLYLEVLAQLEKLPWLFRNVVAVSTAELDAVFV